MTIARFVEGTGRDHRTLGAHREDRSKLEDGVKPG